MTVTDKMIEAGCKAFLEVYGDPWSEPSDYYDEVKAALEAALSASPAGVVKPLEWEPGVVHWARPLPGMKYVACSRYPSSEWSWWLDSAEGPVNPQVLPTEEAAKSAAFADYSARIMSAIEPAGVGVEMEAVPYQNRVADAHYALFHDDPTDIPERNARAFEEATETAQAFGMTRDEAVALVDYTFSRPVGDPAKEIGAKILTAFSLGVVAGIDVMAAAEADLEKLQRPETIARIRAKRATRHGRGPLPGFDPAALKGDKQ